MARAQRRLRSGAPRRTVSGLRRRVSASSPPQKAVSSAPVPAGEQAAAKATDGREAGGASARKLRREPGKGGKKADKGAKAMRAEAGGHKTLSPKAKAQDTPSARRGGGGRKAEAAAREAREGAGPASAASAPRAREATGGGPQGGSPDGAAAGRSLDALSRKSREYHAVPQIDEESDAFFSRPPDVQHADELWDHDDERPPMTRGARWAMLATFSILGASVLGIGAYAGYHALWVPTPARVGDALVRAEFPEPVLASEVEAEESTDATQGVERQGLESAAETASKDAVQSAEVESDVEGAAPEGSAAAVEASAVEPAPEARGEAADPQPAEAAGDEEALLAEARRLYRQGRIARAVRAYERAVAINPNSAEALSRLAYYYLNASDPRAAEDYAERAVAVDPDNSEGWIVLGAAREQLDDPDNARLAYSQCAQASGRYVVECRRLLRR